MLPFHVPKNSKEDSFISENFRLSMVVLKVITLKKDIEAKVKTKIK